MWLCTVTLLKSTPFLSLLCAASRKRELLGSGSQYFSGSESVHTPATLHQQPSQLLIIREPPINTQQLRLVFNSRGDDDAINRVFVMFGQRNCALGDCPRYWNNHHTICL